MDNRNEVREFLRSRRARITPAQAGLPVFGDHRRVPGLRREEVSMLAGVSVNGRRDILAANVMAYTAEPGTRSEEGLSLLGSWAATVDHVQATGDA